MSTAEEIVRCVVDVKDLCSVAADAEGMEQRQQTAYSAQGRLWCLRLGMTASSWDGWAKIHVNPLVAIRFFFLPTMGDILLRYYLFTSLPVNGSLLFYAVTLPHSINIAECVAGSCAMFRIGPQLVQHRMYPLGVVAAVSLALPVWYVGYIGPPGTVPWNNRFKLLVYGFVADLLAHLAGAAGWLPGEHPVEPRTSIRKHVPSSKLCG